jgi:hypothetical protein
MKTNMPIDYFADLATIVNQALAEDVGSGDITAALIDESKTATATVITRDDAIICGKPWVDSVFETVNPNIHLHWFIAEGDSVTPGTKLFEASGRTRSLLTAERTALNFLQTLSGTATETHRLVKLIGHTETELLDSGLRKNMLYISVVETITESDCSMPFCLRKTISQQAAPLPKPLPGQESILRNHDSRSKLKTCISLGLHWMRNQTGSCWIISL